MLSTIRLQRHEATVISAQSGEADKRADVTILHRWPREEASIRIHLQRGGGDRQDQRRVIDRRRYRWLAPSTDGGPH